MSRRSVLLLYGIDAQMLAIDAEVTLHSIKSVGEVLSARGWRVAVSEVNNDLNAALAAFAPDEWIVFNLCEGSPGQTFYYARVARELERRGYEFTGSDSNALHQTQFKGMMKRLLEWHGVPTPRWQLVERAEDVSFDAFPAIVKPAAEHCSFGITRESVVLTLDEARARTEIIQREYSGGALIEEFLDSEEYGISLWGGTGDSLELLGISVIRYDAFPDLRDRLCSFDAKWLPETDAYKKTMPTCPAPLTQERQAELVDLARRAHSACGGRDYSRIDVRLRDGQPMVLDVNINCAVSENSGFVDTARLAAGLEYGEVLERLIEMAAARSTSRENSPVCS